MHRFRIGVLTSGGDCPGLNAVIRATVASAHTLGWEVLGFIDGYEGLLSPVSYRVLTVENTEGIMPVGGTIIGTTNRGRFVAKAGHGEKAQIPQPIIDEAKRTLEELNIGALVCIGGDGSLTTAEQLFENGVPVVGVPKTIDNDLSATAMTFGFDSAVACVADALDRLHTTAASHKRVMVLEVMGRYAGWIALNGGLSGGADAILIPEIPFSYDKVAGFVQERMARGANSTLIVVAEGAFAQGTNYSTLEGSAAGERRLGGIGAQVAQEIMSRNGSRDAPGGSWPPSTGRCSHDAGSHPRPALRGGCRQDDRGKEIRAHGQLFELSHRCGFDSGGGRPIEAGAPDRTDGRGGTRHRNSLWELAISSARSSPAQSEPVPSPVSSRIAGCGHRSRDSRCAGFPR